MCINSFNSITVVTVIIPILQTMKLRHREVKELAQGHIAGKWQSQDLTQLVHPQGHLLSAVLSKGKLFRFSQDDHFYILSVTDVRKSLLLCVVLSVFFVII